jgi:hypothetical protein
VDVCLSKPKALDELEQKIRGFLFAIFPEFLERGVDFVSSGLQKCVQNAAASVEIAGSGWALKWCRNCGCITLGVGDTAI